MTPSAFLYYPDTMPVRGTVKMSELRLVQLTVDSTSQNLQVSAMAALVDPATNTAAWVKCNGNVWGKETMEKLGELMEAMEQDMARTVMDDVDTPNGVTGAPQRAQQPAGLGEHLNGDDIPQV